MAVQDQPHENFQFTEEVIKMVTHSKNLVSKTIIVTL